MPMTNAQKQAARRERLAGLQITVTLTPETRAILDKLTQSGMTQSQAIIQALKNTPH